jgi:hypothetical protein
MTPRIWDELKMRNETRIEPNQKMTLVKKGKHVNGEGNGMR